MKAFQNLNQATKDTVKGTHTHTHTPDLSSAEGKQANEGGKSCVPMPKKKAKLPEIQSNRTGQGKVYR